MNTSEPKLNDDSHFKFIVPIIENRMSQEKPIDMRIDKEENERQIKFQQKIKELREKNGNVMECSKCLIIFNDFIIYNIHMIMHGPLVNTSPTSWFCTMCRQRYSTRHDFFIHIIINEHSMIPHGVSLPPDIPYVGQFPDLTLFLNNL